MFDLLSGHKSSVVECSVKTFRCVSDFLPVISVTPVKKKILQSHLPKYHRKGVCMQGLCTMIVDVTDVLTTTYCTSHEDRC